MQVSTGHTKRKYWLTSQPFQLQENFTLFPFGSSQNLRKSRAATSSANISSKGYHWNNKWRADIWHSAHNGRKESALRPIFRGKSIATATPCNGISARPFINRPFLSHQFKQLMLKIDKEETDDDSDRALNKSATATPQKIYPNEAESNHVNNVNNAVVNAVDAPLQSLPKVPSWWWNSYSPILIHNHTYTYIIKIS